MDVQDYAREQIDKGGLSLSVGGHDPEVPRVEDVLEQFSMCRPENALYVDRVLFPGLT